MVDSRQSPKQARITRLTSLFGLLILAGLPVTVILVLVLAGTHQAVVAAIAYACGMLLLWLPLYWLGAIGSWRSANRLWRKRMSTGFYKTLPPVKDDDDE
jgi:Flp pilus assembly protein TadB